MSDFSMDRASRIQNVCALGTGTMGPGVALQFAVSGRDVKLWGRSDESLGSAMRTVKASLESYRKQGLIGDADVPRVLAHIEPTTSLGEATRDADFVLESLFEKMPLKHEYFGKIDALCPEHTIFATNTSALSPTGIASVLSESRQKNFVVTHGFNPFNLMPAIEIVPGAETAPDTVDIACDLMEMIGKKPVRLHCESPGFVVNSIQAAVIWAALELHVSGKATPEEIDTAFKGTLGTLWAQKGPLESAGYQAGHGLHAAGRMLVDRLPSHNHDPEIVSYMQNAALRAAHMIVQGGSASVIEVDKAYKYSLGLRYGETGPLQSADMGGLDIFNEIFRTLGYLEKPSTVSAYLQSMVDSNRIGAKTGEGLYLWQPEMLAEVKGRREGVLFDYIKSHLRTNDGNIAPMPSGRPQAKPRPITTYLQLQAA